ncbi:MAG: acetamidase/formamidase family protein [Spirochaetia bacterium]|jgi:acetamidase/formamidase
MKELLQKDYCYTLGRYSKPTLSVTPGESVVVETPDNTANRVKKDSDVVILRTLDHWNPVVGPIYVEGASRGDTLVVEIKEIEPLFDQGWGGLEPGGLCTSGDASGGLYLVHEPIDYDVKICPIRKNTVEIPIRNKRSIFLPFAPMIGTIGTSPEIDSISSLICGAHGGNMDSPDLCPGNKLFCPVYVEGALLYLGDVHALQSDGELGGPPVEIASKCTLTIELIKKKAINWPRIESSEYIMTVGNSCPLDNSLRIACSEMLFWLKNEYRYSMEDAIFLSSTVFKSRINQVVNPSNSSVTVMFPKRMLNL